jgi:hypothetical protein
MLHLISFGAPFDKYSKAHSRFHKSATELDKINLFSEKNMFDFSNDLNLYRDFITSSNKGYGYWMWKYFLISEIMKSIPEDDLIFYADIGCSFNVNENSKKKFSEYRELAEKHGSLCFDIKHIEDNYTKMDTYLRIFPSNEEHKSTGQRCATAFFLKNTQKFRDIVEEIKTICIENDHHYITDKPSLVPNSYCFVGHRHDQSVFSLISKKYDFFCIPDETYWFPNWNDYGKNYPIWARRDI